MLGTLCQRTEDLFECKYGFMQQHRIPGAKYSCISIQTCQSITSHYCKYFLLMPHSLCNKKSWNCIRLDLFPQERVLKCQKTHKISTGLTYIQKAADWSTACGVYYFSAARKNKAWSFIFQPETLEPLGDHNLNQELKHFPNITSN